ncbi:MAG: hypothetical protein ACOYMR_15200 [Ilumatobacteraceae bacterium]
MAGNGKRPFWMHQLVEYILGGAMAYSGLMSPTPLVPAVCGGLIVLNAALTKSSIGAFRAYGRNLHRTFDIVIICICLVAVGQPWIELDGGTRIVILAITSVHIVVFFGSSYVEKQKAPKAPKPTGTADLPTGDRSTDLGRSAGRIVGSGVNTIRKFTGSGEKDS